jgi:hypothetical protein
MDKIQAYFWSPEWQAAEREADEDIAARRVLAFDNADEAIAHLHNEQAAITLASAHRPTVHQLTHRPRLRQTLAHLRRQRRLPTPVHQLTHRPRLQQTLAHPRRQRHQR